MIKFNKLCNLFLIVLSTFYWYKLGKELFLSGHEPCGLEVNSTLLQTRVQKPLSLMRVYSKTLSLLLKIALLICIFIIE